MGVIYIQSPLRQRDLLIFNYYRLCGLGDSCTTNPDGSIWGNPTKHIDIDTYFKGYKKNDIKRPGGRDEQ